MHIDVTYGFHCSADGCDVTAVDHHADVWTGRIPAPRLPDGWQAFGLLVFCAKHTLMLQVDGQPHMLDAASEEA